jgi:hypothetical protein
LKQLLIDTFPLQFSSGQLNESKKSNNGKLIIPALLQRANAPNQNKRRYPKQILERECNRYIENEVKQKRALGELDHSDSSVVNLKNVSHNITEVWWEGDDVWGNLEIIKTPAGRIAEELINAGITIGISSRGLGSVKNLNEDDNDEVEVQSDFELVCWDLVSNPSTHGAFLKPTNFSDRNIKESVSKIKAKSKEEKLIQEIICDLSGVCCI